VQLTGINSLFLDVDGTGMASDDYNPASPTSADAMAAARNNRLRSVAENIRIPLGSEDGNAVTAQYLMFAHGTETRGFGWSDAD
ncbi:glycoside hydrolase, partial [Pseudomonas aeruginosa]